MRKEMPDASLMAPAATAHPFLLLVSDMGAVCPMAHRPCRYFTLKPAPPAASRPKRLTTTAAMRTESLLLIARLPSVEVCPQGCVPNFGGADAGPAGNGAIGLRHRSVTS